MKTEKPYYFVTRCVLLVLFGIAAAWAGVDLLTARGWPLLAVLVAISLVDGIHAKCAVYRAFHAGQRHAVSFVVLRGWVK